MSNLFNQIRGKKPRTNVFDLSHEKKLSMKMGELVPIYLQEIVPGDKFKVNTEVLMRLAPMMAPMMHRVNQYVHYFFVPNRLVYGEWEDFITGGVTGNIMPYFPKITLDENTKDLFGFGSLADYMGVPSVPAEATITNELEISGIPFRAYQLIWNEYFRDPTLQTEIAVSKDSIMTLQEQRDMLTLRKRCWEKDYFTSALPWSQRGGDVTIPNTPVYAEQSKVNLLSGQPSVSDGMVSNATGDLINSTGGQPIRIENIEGLDITINELRRASRLQEWLEKNARGGPRYIEQILSHFGVVSSDARLQRPEYLGGGKSPIVISEVLQTSDVNTGGRVLGDMAGHGISIGNNMDFKKSFEEHGYVIGILSVLPRTAYQNGVDRTLLKFDKFDYYWPEFANLGEQEIINKELYYDPAEAVNANDAVFGYQSRYAEYKYKQSMVHGAFRDNLAHWHMGRIFDTRPGLNSTFVESQPTTRVFNVSLGNLDHLWIQVYNQVRAIRPMPTFGTPML